MTQIFKTSNYSKFKTIPSSELSKEEKELAKAIRHAYSMGYANEELEIGTHYESLEKRKKGIRKIYCWKMFTDLHGESYEIKIWHKPKLDAQRIDN